MGGEVNKIKKAIMRPQHKPCNYVPKFNQNSFPHWACNVSNRPRQVLPPRPSTEIGQGPEVFLQRRPRAEWACPGFSHLPQLIQVSSSSELPFLLLPSLHPVPTAQSMGAPGSLREPPGLALLLVTNRCLCNA